jgi:hypothetical protein
MPPEVPYDLKPWIAVSTDPTKEPSIKDYIPLHVPTEQARALVALGRVNSQDVSEADGQADGSEPGDVQVRIRLAKFPEIRTAVDKYVKGPWTAWSDSEKKVKKAKSIYDKFFTLHHSIASGTLQRPLELIWGIGLFSWKNPVSGLVYHPLIEIPVELSINQATAAISISPIGRAPKIAENLVASFAEDGATTFLLSAAKVLDGYLQASRFLSPFDNGSYEQLLHLAATEISPNGEFRASKGNGSGQDHEPTDHLVVIDSWAIYARPRSESYLIQDLKRQREALTNHAAAGKPLPGFAKKIVRDEKSEPPPLPPVPDGRPLEVRTGDDTFFLPKAFNEDQIAILSKLEQSDQDGAVVQGPPGTGETHTIANLVCHYMATGRRVLVTSHTEGALTVLRDQIPEAMRNLTVSLLTNEREGIEQLGAG